MKSRLIACSVFILVTFGVVAQQSDSQLQTYLAQFEKATPPVKLQILRSAGDQPAEQMGPLYRKGLEYVVSNAPSLATDNVLQNMLTVSLEGAVNGNYKPAVGPLWSLFDVYDETTMRIRILRALGQMGTGDQGTVTLLNRWVMAQNNLFRAGTTPDLQVMSQAVKTLGILNDPSSFNVLMDVIITQYSTAISDAARTALYGLPGDVVEMAVNAIHGRDVPGKLQALDFLLGEEKISADQNARIAAAALQDAVTADASSIENQDARRQLRIRAAAVVREAGYSQATPAMIQAFNQTYRDYDTGRVKREWFLDMIAGLGAMETDAASDRLVTFLDMMNNYTEHGKPVDERVALAVVTNLGILGRASAYNSLFYATLLDYSARVKTAAKEALDKLQQ